MAEPPVGNELWLNDTRASPFCPMGGDKKDEEHLIS